MTKIVSKEECDNVRVVSNSHSLSMCGIPQYVKEFAEKAGIKHLEEFSQMTQFQQEMVIGRKEGTLNRLRIACTNYGLSPYAYEDMPRGGQIALYHLGSTLEEFSRLSEFEQTLTNDSENTRIELLRDYCQKKGLPRFDDTLSDLSFRVQRFFELDKERTSRTDKFWEDCTFQD